MSLATQERLADIVQNAKQMVAEAVDKVIGTSVFCGWEVDCSAQLDKRSRTSDWSNFLLDKHVSLPLEHLLYWPVVKVVLW